jgi:four helix bundle protein
MRNVKCEVLDYFQQRPEKKFGLLYYLFAPRTINRKNISMNHTSQNHFNDQIRKRTLKMAAGVRNLFVRMKINPIDRPQVLQLTRSASSVAANYRSATRGRSDAEYFSKICIVVEEVDETLFWLEYFIELDVVSRDLNIPLIDEVTQLVRLFSTIKRKMKEKLDGQKE